MLTMEKIAKDLNLRMFSSSAFFRRFPKIGNLLGQHFLSGKLRGREFTIYVTKFPRCNYFPLSLVVETQLLRPASPESPNITIKSKPFLYSMHRIFNGNIRPSGYHALDTKLLFSAGDRVLLEKILQYEELQDQLCEIWDGRRQHGALFVGNCTVTYHEPFRRITNSIRRRTVKVAALIGDIADVISVSTSARYCGGWNVFSGEK
ncbi:MAG: hypothetical protein LBB18_02265 [Puniceicoccales bacterium]|jgi:hypothetical protein|nr:hypothetical protein [Puniceicoccales bacterium]